MCNSKGLGCAGDIRLNQWTTNGYGLVDRVLWTARNGSTVAGRVWATRAGPRKRPAIVITNGSIQASEELYWYAAQTLAKAGYVVVTFDPQMQGLSDTYGEGADRNEGFPSQTAGQHVLRLDPGRHRLPAVHSRQAVLCPAQPLGHEPLRQAEPAREGRAQRALQPHVEAASSARRIGIAGHSYGASGVSWMGQQDPRVDAVVAWDNLCDPALVPGARGDSPTEGAGCSSGARGRRPATGCRRWA